jgi:hypothetical protein
MHEGSEPRLLTEGTIDKQVIQSFDLLCTECTCIRVLQAMAMIRVWRTRVRVALGRRGSCWRAHRGEEERRLGLGGAVESPGSLREAENN